MKDSLIGSASKPEIGDYDSAIDFNDPKIKFIVKYAVAKSVLDLGCVQHNPENYKSKYWLHRALKKVASSLQGVDLYEDGVNYLNQLGFSVRAGDVQNLNIGQKYDLIVAGDLIEHLDNFRGFFLSVDDQLSKDGKLIITTPNPWYWRNIIKAIISPEVSNNEEHTCWICLRTLRQLAARFNFKILEFKFGSRYKKDLYMPLPSRLKNTSLFVILARNNDI